MVAVRQMAPELLANRRGGRGRGLKVVVPAHRKTPRLPTPPAGLDWSRAVRSYWRAFWRSPVSAAVDVQADGERLYRWMEAIEERERLLAAVRADGYAPARRVVAEVEDENGTTTIVLMAGANPNLAYIKHLDREIARLSEHFGMTPLSRFRLQMTFAESQKSAIGLRKAQDAAERVSPPPAPAIVDLDAL